MCSHYVPGSILHMDGTSVFLKQMWLGLSKFKRGCHHIACCIPGRNQKPAVAGRMLEPQRCPTLSSEPVNTMVHGKGETTFAAGIKVANLLTLKQKDHPGGPNIIARVLKIRQRNQKGKSKQRDVRRTQLTIIADFEEGGRGHDQRSVDSA